MPLQRKTATHKRPSQGRTAKKGEARGINDRVPTKRGKGACTHQDKAPCFKVNLSTDDKDYHFPDEEGAVMFALRYSRDLECDSMVFDPLGNVIVDFKPREYDWLALKASRPTIIHIGGDNSVGVRPERKSGGTAKKEEGKPRREAAAKKAVGKKTAASEQTRRIKRTR